MHSARSIRVKQLVPGVRTVATAPKFTSAQALGKWSLPKSSLSDTPAPTGSPAASPLGRWARPPQAYPGPPSHSKSSAWSGKPSHVKTTPSLQSRSTARANATSPSLSKWARPSPAEPSTSQRPGIAETRQSTTAGFQREAAPHNGRPPLPDHRPLSGRSQSNNLAVTGDDGGSGVRSSKESGPSVGAEKESSFSPIDELVETIANEKEYTRNAKYARKTFKERGSIASRISEGVTIPRHSRVKVTQVQKSKERERKVKRNVRKVNLDVFIPSVVSVGNLARLLDIRIERLQRKMVQVGMEDQSSYDHMLNSEYASLLAMEFNRNPIVNDEAAFDIYPPPTSAEHATLPSRPPVVTIMGHVDHGKTTLLDTLRSTSVAKGEAGGITQHIGAFSVPVPASPDDPNSKRAITFLDTPGHAAFSAMRARGASVTDIVVLVVAADDGIMPQTREVLELVKKESDKIGLVVAINKIDKPSADVGKVETALLAEGIQLESFGGDVPCVHVSGLTGDGLPQLVETISLLAEMQDLRAEITGQMQGYVLESKVLKGLGAVATVLVSRGELKIGTHVIAGTAHGKVRLLTAPSGSPVKVVPPGTAAVVAGWKELPKAGDEVLSGAEGDVKRALANRLRKVAEMAMMEDMEAINQSRREERERQEIEESEEEEETAEVEEQKKELRIVLKGDVSGSVEAVEGALQGIGNHLAGVKIVASGVGDVSESDILRAKAVDGIVVAFAVNIPRSIENIAAGQGVSTLKSSIIYQLMDLVKERVIALLPKIVEKKVTGEANVIQLFDITVKGKKTTKVAGCRVINGTIEKNKMARVIRKGETVYEGKLETLRHLKKDILQAGKDLECGMAFAKWDELREGDLVQTYQEIEKPASL